VLYGGWASGASISSPSVRDDILGLVSAEGHVERIRLRLGFQTRAQVAAWYVSRRDEPAR
jgi:hypothetical protein